MSYQVLARKWRPQTFDEVIGQEHIVRSLTNQISSNTLGHAFLFSGTRGVGKTSLARILAKSLRCQNLSDNYNPCNKCDCCIDTTNDSSMDVLEVDGASNNSVDNIRDIIESVKFLPVIGAKRIFIIDEVHMLSGSAFNALLKTLEEPPSHAIFIFATTEPEKVPATVLSRCQKFDFLNVSISTLLQHVLKIADVEGITFESKLIAEKICRHGDGSVRDTLTLLEQALMYSSDRIISADLIEKSLGIIQEDSIETIIEYLFLGEVDRLKNFLFELRNSRIKTENLCLELGKKFHQMVIDHINHRGANFSIQLKGNKFETNNSEIMWIFNIFSKESSEALEGIFATQAMEILLLKLCLRREMLSSVGVKISGTSTSSLGVTQNETIQNIKEENKTEEKIVVEKITEDLNVSEVKLGEENVNNITEELEKNWESFLEHFGKISPASASNLEQGNILGKVDFKKNESLKILLGFSSESEVFYDYISEKASRAKILTEMSHYFELQEEKIDFELKLLEDEEKQRIGFNSIVEIDEKNKKIEIEEKTKTLLNNEIIVEAQKLFNSEVDKTIVQ